MIGRTILDPNPDAGQIFIASQLASIYADMAKREPVQTATMETLGINWLPNYQVRVVPDTQLIEISVPDTNPQTSSDHCQRNCKSINASKPGLSTNNETGRRQEFIKQQLSSLQTQIQDTENKIDELQQGLAGLNSASQIDRTQNEISQLSDKLSTLRDSYALLLSNTQGGALNILSVFEPANLPTIAGGDK